MACGGCRRKRKSSGSRTKPKTTKIASPVKASVTGTMLADRKKKCSKCPFNTITGLSGRCKKTNRMISRSISDPSFKCPIKRF